MCILMVRRAEQFLSLFALGAPLGGQVCILVVRAGEQFLSLFVVGGSICHYLSFVSHLDTN